MKTYSENKSKMLKIIVSVSLAIVAVFLLELFCYWVKKPAPPLFLDCAIFLLGSVGFFRILEDDVDEDICIPPLENGNILRWGVLKGPCTWEQAVAIANNKADSWRLPTALELRERIFEIRPLAQDLPALFWTEKNNQVLSVNGGYQLMPPNTVAHFYLVSEF